MVILAKGHGSEGCQTVEKLRGHLFRYDRQRFTCGLVPLARLNYAFALLGVQSCFHAYSPVSGGT